MNYLWLGIIAFITGTGTAFCSLLTEDSVYVKAIISKDGETNCVRTSGKCDDTGQSICRISISTISGKQNAATTNSVFRTYKVGCIQPLRAGFDAPLQEVTTSDNNIVFSLTIN